MNCFSQRFFIIPFWIRVKEGRRERERETWLRDSCGRETKNSDLFFVNVDKHSITVPGSGRGSRSFESLTSTDIRRGHVQTHRRTEGHRHTIHRQGSWCLKFLQLDQVQLGGGTGSRRQGKQIVQMSRCDASCNDHCVVSWNRRLNLTAELPIVSDKINNFFIFFLLSYNY